MSTLADRIIDALQANHDSLVPMVEAMSDDDLARVSGSSEWDVAQVLSHLGSAAEIQLTSVRAALADVEPPTTDYNREVWARWDALDNRSKAEGYLVSNALLLDAYGDIDATTRERIRFPLGFLPEPATLALYTGMRLNEVAMHAWDVRIAFDPDATVPSAEAGLLLEVMNGPLAFMLRFLGKPERLDGRTAVVRIDTSEPDISFGLVVGEAVGVTAAPESVDGLVRVTADALVRLVNGRLDPDAASALIDAQGALSSGDLVRLFPGM